MEFTFWASLYCLLPLSLFRYRDFTDMGAIIDKHGNIAFFGRLSWGNLLDWLVTLCLSGIIMLTTVSLGGVRPDTHLVLLPLFVLMMVLHGIWLFVDREQSKRLSHVPLFFFPALLWMLYSILWVSPVPWRGWNELIYTLEAFLFFWVLCNNVRTRAHLWFLLFLSLAPSIVAIFNGFYQFFQAPDRMVGALTDYEVVLNPVFLGRATGVFADPDSFAAFLLILLPSLLIAASVKRLPKILRLLCLYIVLMFFLGIAFAQSYWASASVVVLVACVPWFCFRRLKYRVLFSCLGVCVASLVFIAMIMLHFVFSQGLERVFSEEGEGVRLVLWQEAIAMTAEHPIAGVGAGAYGAAFEQSPRVELATYPETPHNDFLLILSQFGIVGLCLLAAPTLYVFFRAWSRWRKEPFVVKLRNGTGKIMPPQRFFLSLGLAGVMAFALCMVFTFVLYVPALLLYGVLAFAILVKSSFNRLIELPSGVVLRGAYLLLASCVGWSFYVFATTQLEADALQLRAQQELEHIVDLQVHVSGDQALLDGVIVLYEDAVISDPKNVDAWIGLSAAVCQLYFRSPSNFERTAQRAVNCAQRATVLSPSYWKAWSQLGVARSFAGEAVSAEAAFVQALKLAPNNSNAHYYYAAFLSVDRDRHEQALSLVRRAMEINPHNSAARRLEQKLLIL
jgi:O-antigen ligase